MQSPTPPTKPIPPTPPSMKTSSGSTGTETPAKSAPSQTLLPVKKQEPSPAPNSNPQYINVPPMTNSSTSGNFKEMTSETAIPSPAQLPKKNPSSLGFSFFFVLILLLALALVGAHWWKTNNRKQKSTVDYSAESSNDIVNLILSPNDPEPAPQVVPKTLPKKILPKIEPKTKPKGGFEVRI